jgi:RimJ/RimL family protein N-acetyltransferase
MLRPTYPIETARLRLCPFTLDDLDPLYTIQSRPDVMRYLYGEPRSHTEVRAMLATRAQHPTMCIRFVRHQVGGERPLMMTGERQAP